MILPLLADAAAAPDAIPAWTVVPFAVYLLAIAVIPLFYGHFWEHNRNKFIVAVVISLPVIGYLLFGNPHGGEWLIESFKEYVAFLTLLAALFVISGGIYVKGSLSGTPLANTGLMALGALLASAIGTTGASMVLIRPLLRANEKRVSKTHIVVLFIFIVSNGAGLLTPLGDPPLFLGFLRGVPFTWTFRLAPQWLVVNGALLAIFHVMDEVIFNREERQRPGSQLEEVQQHDPVRIEGGLNLLWLLGVVAIIFAMGAFGDQIAAQTLPAPPAAEDQEAFAHYRHALENRKHLFQVGGMAVMILLSLFTTKQVREENRFSWGPIVEVAVIFLGIFVTMVPALKFLAAKGAELGVTEPWQFFWASGAPLSFLDNAPTYLTFATLATGVVNQLDPGANLDPANLGGLAAHADLGVALLTAVSCGSVFMGANTYIGNGPNFMVKAIAEESGVKMPSFFGYMLWSGSILIPLFVVITLLFFL